MSPWDRFILFAWRCTIGPVLFCLLLICGIASFFIGGRRFFLGCWKMATFSELADWDPRTEYGHWASDGGQFGEQRYFELGTTNLISRLLWTLLFGIWLRVLFVLLMCVAHLLLCSDWLAGAMLQMANCARNPAYFRVFSTRNWVMEDDGRLHKIAKEFRLFFPYEISRRSDLSKLEGKDWVLLLFRRPQFADKCDWQKLDGKDWRSLLQDQPQFADKCDWQKLDGWDWSSLLQHQPQFADKCDWQKLDGGDWSALLQDQPQFADMCDWQKLDGGNWMCLLSSQPRFADKCDWQKLDGGDWSSLLQDQPQFADMCDKWDEMNGENWANLLSRQPQFANMCDWYKLDDYDWERLLENQPKFAFKRRE